MSLDETVRRFGPWIVDGGRRTLTRDGVPSRLAWRHFEALKLLIDARGGVVAREQFFARLWPDTPHIDESNLTQCIAQLRKALATADGATYIETVPRQGYRLAVPVDVVAGADVLPVDHTDVAAHADHAVVPIEPSDAVARGGHRRVLWLAATVVAVVAAAGWWWWRPARVTPEELSREAQSRAAAFYRQGDGKAAVQELRLAVRLDPTNARAFGELAHALNRLDAGGIIPTPIGESPSVQAAARGVELDPQCAVCAGTLGFFLFYHDWRWAEAEQQYITALRLAPESYGIRASFAMLLAATGRLSEARAQIDQALAGDPLQLSWHYIRTATLLFERRYEESIAAADKALAITEGERSLWDLRSRALFQLGRHEDAMKALVAGPFADHSQRLEAAVVQGGRDGGLRELLAITDGWQRRTEQSWRRAQWRALLRDSEGALDELEAAYRVRNVNLIYVAVDPVYDGLHDHPRFQRLLDGLGLRLVRQ